jgi:hypothetical protein
MYALLGISAFSICFYVVVLVALQLDTRRRRVHREMILEANSLRALECLSSQRKHQLAGWLQDGKNPAWHPITTFRWRDEASAKVRQSSLLGHQHILPIEARGPQH